MDLTYSNSAHYVKNPCTPKSQCFSARVGKSDVGGLMMFDFFRPLRHIGANAPHINFELWGRGCIG